MENGLNHTGIFCQKIKPIPEAVKSFDNLLKLLKINGHNTVLTSVRFPSSLCSCKRLMIPILTVCAQVASPEARKT